MIKDEAALGAIAFVLALMILIFDLSLPSGVAGGVPYVTLPLLGFWSGRKRITLYLTVAAIVLILTGHFFTPLDESAYWIILSNRALAIFAVLVAAILVISRHNAESEKKLIQDNLINAQSIAHLGSWDWSADRNVEIWSDEQYRIHGYEPGSIEPTLDNFIDTVHPDDKESVLNAVNETLATLKPYSVEYRIIRPDSTERFVFSQGEVTRSKDGKPLYVVGTTLDITERKLSENRLIDSESRYRRLFDNASDIVLTLGLDGSIKSANQALIRVLGYEENQLPDLDIYKITADESHGLVKEMLSGNYRGGFRCCEIELISNDGILIPAEVSGQRINRDGHPPEHQCFLRDITDSKLAEEAMKKREDKYRKLIESAPDPIFVADAESGEIVDANPMMERMLGYSKNDLAGKHFTFIHPGDQTERYIDLFEKFVQTGEQIEEDLEVAGSDGSRIPIDIRGSLIDVEDSRYVVWIFRDITYHKHAQEKLSEAKKKSDDAVLTRDRFLSIVSHDLRSPLASISSQLEAVLNDNETRLSKKAEEYLTNAHFATKQQMTMISDLLAIGRLASGATELQQKTFEAKNVVHYFTITLKHLADKKGISLQNNVPEGMKLFADMDLYGQIIQNLVSNAIKFTNKGGEITIFAPEGGSTIAVQDNGTGIDKEIIEDIFKPDIKTTSLGTSGEVGAGFGLPFCKEVMIAHGGDLEVSSIKDKGSVFFVHLPPKTPSILIVDDEDNMIKVLRVYLESLGVTLHMANNGAEAIEILKNVAPQLVIADIMMPGMDGFGLLREIKSKPKTQSIPVILMTADRDIDSRNRAFKLGAADFVTKPFSVEDFLPRVKRFVS